MYTVIAVGDSAQTENTPHAPMIVDPNTLQYGNNKGRCHSERSITDPGLSTRTHMPRYEGTEIHCCPLVGELNVAMEAGSTTTSWFAVTRRAEDGTVIWSADQAKRTVTQCTTWRSPGSSSEPTIILQRI